VKTLARFGPKRGGVRVYEDRDRQLVRAAWREQGRKRFHSFPLTPAGRAEAKAWAKGFVEVRGAPDPVPTPTVRELWALYAEAEFPHLRPRTRKIYGDRWRLFERFVTHDTRASGVAQQTLDRFGAELRKQEYVPNQIGEHLKVVKMAFAWAKRRKVLPATDVPDYRVRLAKEEHREEPAEYRTEDFDQLLLALAPEGAACRVGPNTWRAWAVMMLLGHQGVRVNAALHLRWTDIEGDWVHWAPEYDKLGRRDFDQPLLWPTIAALQTARHWREHDGYAGQWVFYAARLARLGRDEPWSYQGLWYAVTRAEVRAGVPHLDLRGAHGLRRMVAGNVAEEFGDPMLAMQFIGDRDPRLIRRYVKRRDDRMQEVADRMGGTRNRHPSGTVGATTHGGGR